MNEEPIIKISGESVTLEEAEELYFIAQTFFKHIIGVSVRHA